MTIDGWVKLHRALSVDPIWTAQPFTKGQAWVDLIILANHTDGYILVRGVRLEVKRGQVGYSEVTLADRWKWSRGKVRRYLEEIEKKEGKIVQQKNNVSSIIHLVNYDKYQLNDTADDTADGQQTDSRRYTNKNEKNVKKVFIKPTIDEIICYCQERQNGVDPHRWYNHYEAKGWMIGKEKMKDWKAAVRTWENYGERKKEGWV